MSGITWSASGGSPASSPALRRISAVSRAQRIARGDGRQISTLRVLAATMALKSTVEVGLVTGRIAITTPMGSATYWRFRSGSSRITPTVFLSFR